MKKASTFQNEKSQDLNQKVFIEDEKHEENHPF